MTSAANLLPPLNGNKILTGLLILACVGWACSAPKSAVKPESIPEKKTEKADIGQKPVLKVDTVHWTEKKMDAPATIDQNNQVKVPPTNIRKKVQATSGRRSDSVYQILTLLPFVSTEVDTAATRLSPQMLRYIHFYAGMEMAVTDFGSKLNHPVEIKVRTAADSSDLNTILKESERNLPHLILGPQKPDLIKMAAEWAQQNDVNLISPWVSSSTLVEGNPNYIQVKPSLIAHYKYINDYVRRAYPVDHITLVLRDDEAGKDQYFNDTSRYHQKMEVRILKELDLATSNEPIITGLLRPEGTTVFVLPMGSTRDETFVYHFLRRVASEKELKDVVVFGMSKWLEMKSDVIDLLHSQQVRMSASNFADPDLYEIRSFKKRYFDRYREFPSEDVLEGYDLMHYCLHSLCAHGPEFHRSLYDEKNVHYLQTQYEILPVYRNASEASGQPDYYENGYIRLVELKNNKLREIE